MQLDTDVIGSVVNRLRRAEGQIGGVIRMLQEGRDGEQGAIDRGKLEKLFLSLA